MSSASDPVLFLKDKDLYRRLDTACRSNESHSLFRPFPKSFLNGALANEVNNVLLDLRGTLRSVSVLRTRNEGLCKNGDKQD